MGKAVPDRSVEILPHVSERLADRAAATPTCRVDPPESQAKRPSKVFCSSQPQPSAMEAPSVSFGLAPKLEPLSVFPNQCQSHSCPFPPMTSAGSGSRHCHCHCPTARPGLALDLSEPGIGACVWTVLSRRFSRDLAELFFARSPAVRI